MEEKNAQNDKDDDKSLFGFSHDIGAMTKIAIKCGEKTERKSETGKRHQNRH